MKIESINKKKWIISAAIAVAIIVTIMIVRSKISNALEVFSNTEGNYTEEEYANAYYWCYVASMHGNKDAQNQLGLCYYYGVGVERDKNAAERLFRGAAERNHANAQYNLGNYYYNSPSHPYGFVNSRKAVIWYKKAAKQGHIDAQYKLACCYDDGEGALEDVDKAFMWYNKAAEQGSVQAQAYLGTFYYRGRGVEQDYSKAVGLFQKAAEQGSVLAQASLGQCYEMGHGVAQDSIKSEEWYDKVVAQGYGKLIKLLKEWHKKDNSSSKNE